VEGPVANDKIQNTLRVYQQGKISKVQFLEMLTYLEETHQLCFCTLNSLQCIERIDDASTFDIIMISESLLEKLMLDKNIDENTATDLFYSSKTFAQLADETTQFYKKSWQEIYEMLGNELNLDKNIDNEK
jgi:hypothetical protein